MLKNSKLFYMPEKRIYSIEPNNHQKWSEAFAKLAVLLQGIFTDQVISIEHVGSTSVPGLDGKPTLDILALVKDITVIDSYKEAMKVYGFDDLGEYVAPGGRLFKQDNNGARAVNIHVYEPGHEKVEEMLVMKDYLRTHPEEVQAYAAVKKKLFVLYPNDCAAYRSNKNLFLKDLKDRALEWRMKNS